MYGWEALYFNAKDGYLEGIVRGLRKGLLTVRPSPLQPAPRCSARRRCFHRFSVRLSTPPVAPDGGAAGLQGCSGWQIPLLAVQAQQLHPRSRRDVHRYLGTSEPHQGTAQAYSRGHTV